MRKITGQEGVALITSLFFLVIVTALAAGAIMLATVQVKVAGGMSCWEAAYAAAEAGQAYTLPLLVNVHYEEGVPISYGGGIDLATEGWNSDDDVDTNPDVTYIMPDNGNITVSLDIDSIGPLQLPGFSIEESIRYHKGMAEQGTVIDYHFTSKAATTGNRCSAVITRSVYLKPSSR